MFGSRARRAVQFTLARVLGAAHAGKERTVAGMQEGPLSRVKCSSCGHTPCEANPTGQPVEECAAEAKQHILEGPFSPEESKAEAEAYVAEKIRGHEHGPPCHYS